jgi:hypothetical protein
MSDTLQLTCRVFAYVGPQYRTLGIVPRIQHACREYEARHGFPPTHVVINTQHEDVDIAGVVILRRTNVNADYVHVGVEWPA